MQDLEKRKILTPAQKQRLAFQQQYRCAKCMSLLPSTWQVDHRHPLHLGGTNEWHNLQILCPLCHADKTQLEAIERESIKRQKLSSPPPPSPPSQSHISPYFFNVVDTPVAPPPRYILKRCRAPHISVQYNEP
jgi:Zn finger protein HypA/HybF involved in hydrogenase expression